MAKVRKQKNGRIEALNRWVAKYNEKFDLRRLAPRLNPVSPRTVTQIFAVAELNGQSCELAGHEEGERYEPIVMPPGLMPILRKGDMFMMTILRTTAGWEIGFISPPFICEMRDIEEKIAAAEARSEESEGPLAKYLLQ